MTGKKFGNLTDKGRSITEMLGILAIAGILSLTALAGYRYAVDKYLANDTLDEVNSRAVVAITQLSRGLNTLGQDEFNSVTRHNYAVVTDFLTDTEGFYIQLNAVPKGVCKQLAVSNYTHSISINNVADTTDANLCTDANTVRFTFKTDVGQCNTDADCACGTCNQGRCVSDCPNATACATDFSTGAMICCPYDKLANGMCCNTINKDGLCCDEKGLCCPADKPLINNNGECVPCEGEQTINVTNYEDTCARCSNRFLSYDFNNLGMYWCAKRCPAGQIPDYKGYCHTCEETALYKVIKSGAQNPQTVGGEQPALACPRTLLRYWGDHDISVMNCLSSDQSISVVGYTETCEKCDNRVLIHNAVNSDWLCVKKCPTDKPITDTKGNCHSCDDYGYNIPISTSEAAVRACEKTLMNYKSTDIAEVYNCDQSNVNIPVSNYTDMCSKCPNRNLGGNYCSLKECPDGYVKTYHGTCQSCDSQTIYVINSAECAKCPGKEILIGHSTLACANPTCPDGQFRKIDGTCASCDETGTIQVAQESDCLVCPNRLAQGSMCHPNECSDTAEQQGNKCVCPADKPLMAWNGNCLPCGTATEVWQGTACNACPDMILFGRFCANACKGDAVNKNGICVCPDNKPLMDMDGNCHSCNENADINVYTNPNACDICDGTNGQAKRILKNGGYPLCVLATD